MQQLATATIRMQPIQVVLSWIIAIALSRDVPSCCTFDTGTRLNPLELLPIAAPSHIKFWMAEDNQASADPENNHKKRPRSESDPPASHTIKRALSASEEFENMSLDSKSIQKLSLEAIFLPKFENERSDHQIRNEMLKLVKEEAGYLEVTLKHSGSLILWSGDQRYYSKNSISNQFTLVAETLLRQHFERAWRNEEDTNGIEMYKQCGDYLESNRLTCAFEVVTAVLGDHGDIPTRDFLILTAVADRASERFFTTTQLVELAQQFRLPYNDSWAFMSVASTEKLFGLYDSSRETGMASDTVAALSAAAEAHIQSMYPHTVFQGEILEGFIIRYIPYSDKVSQSTNQEKLASLALKAVEIVTKVPPQCPPCFENNNEPGSLMGSDIREVFQKVGGVEKGTGAAEAFARSLEAILDKSDDGRRRRIHHMGGSKVDLPSLIRGLNTEVCDLETKRIVDLVKTVDGLNKAVAYSLLKEEMSGRPPRSLCVIHVLHDETFLKFQREKEQHVMNLFRGFCVELQEDVGAIETTTNSMESVSEDREQSSNSPVLILKMKMLPYMVRTFICRNQLKVLQQRGPNAFEASAKSLLERWSISPSGKEKWMKFFRYWAAYAYPRLDSHHQDDGLPPLTSFSYLKHMEHFTSLYDSGQAVVPEEKGIKGFKGFVCVVAPKIGIAESCARNLAETLQCSTVLHLSEVANKYILHGVVCFGAVGDRSNKNRAFLSDVSEYSLIVRHGCLPEEIESSMLGETTATIKKISGMSRSWEKQHCHVRHELALDASAGEVDTVVQKAKESESLASQQMGKGESRQGLLVFFPGIPGCGKSSLLENLDSKLEERLQRIDGSEDTRDVKLLVGDKVGKSFWQNVKAARRKNRECVVLADKNAPPVAWNNVAGICSTTNAVSLAILPDESVLKTTRVLGMWKPDGSFDEAKSHFYPFSLLYLGVCLSRVLKRNAASHMGKLDTATPTAAMIVILFYSLYRYKDADEFQTEIDNRMKAGGAMVSMAPVRAPFIKSEEPMLPNEMEDALTEALQIQVGTRVWEVSAQNKELTRHKDWV